MDSSYEAHDQLSPDDQRVLDHLMEAGFDPQVEASLAPADRVRAERMRGLLDLMRDYPVEDAEDALVHATIVGIDRYEDERAARLSFDTRNADASGPRRIRLPDFISVAAIFLIATGVLWPTLSYLRKRSVDMECANNLRYVAYAFGQYADDNNAAMPVAVAGVNSTWDTIANFANLGPLFDGGYCDEGHFRCPGGHDDATAGYSYQCQTPGQHLTWGTAAHNTAVLGDRNPLIDAFRAGKLIPASTISFNHGGRGQWVLGTDGATIWLEKPVIGRGDNIWLPNGLSELERGVRPAAASDVFLTH